MDKNIEESIIIRNNKMVYAVRLKEKDSSRTNSNPYLIISEGKIMYIDRVCSSYTAFNFSDAVHQTAKEIFVSGLRAAVKESLLQLKQLSLILDEMGLKDCLGDVVETNAKVLLQDNNGKQEKTEKQEVSHGDYKTVE